MNDDEVQSRVQDMHHAVALVTAFLDELDQEQRPLFLSVMHDYLSEPDGAERLLTGLSMLVLGVAQNLSLIVKDPIDVMLQRGAEGVAKYGIGHQGGRSSGE